MRTTIAGLAVAAVLVAGPTAAQERPLGHPPDSARAMMDMMHGQQGMMGAMVPCMMMMQRMHGQAGMMSGGMMGMAGGPALMLRLRESLDLAEDQVARLTEIHEAARTEMHHHMMQGMQTMRGAADMIDGASPDMAAYETRMREAADHMVRAHTTMAAADVEAREVLNPQQRERLDVAREMMREMRGGMMGSMTPGMMHPQQGDGHQPPGG